MTLQTHPRFGDLPACTCERRSWQTQRVDLGLERAIGIFKCQACGRLGTVYAPVDCGLVETPDGVQTPDAVVEFGGAFDV